MHSSNGGLHSEAHPEPMNPRAMSGSTVFCFWRLAMCQAGRLAFFKSTCALPKLSMRSSCQILCAGV